MNTFILAASGWEGFAQLMSVLFVFLFVLAITYFCTRWIARYQKSTNVGKNIRVIETCRVTNNKFILLVAAGEVYLVLSVCKDQINLLCQLEPDQLSELPQEFQGTSTAAGENFQDILQKLKDKLPRK